MIARPSAVVSAPAGLGARLSRPRAITSPTVTFTYVLDEMTYCYRGGQVQWLPRRGFLKETRSGAGPGQRVRKADPYPPVRKPFTAFVNYVV